MIQDTFAEDPVRALAIAQGESGANLNARAYNPEWHYRNGQKVCQGSYGVFQIACVHYMHNPEALFDVKFNIEMARKIYDDSHWRPWGAFTDGSYLAYLQ